MVSGNQIRINLQIGKKLTKPPGEFKVVMSGRVNCWHSGCDLYPELAWKSISPLNIIVPKTPLSEWVTSTI